MHIQFEQILIAVLAIAVVLLISYYFFDCSLKCPKAENFTKGTGDKPLIEGYKRACLGGDCAGLQRTPVDYAMKSELGQGEAYGWHKDPHWIACPGSKYQPLSYGPIDLQEDERRLADGVLFQQYGNYWQGAGKIERHLADDTKNRQDLTFVGAYQFSKKLKHYAGSHINDGKH